LAVQPRVRLLEMVALGWQIPLVAPLSPTAVAVAVVRNLALTAAVVLVAAAGLVLLEPRTLAVAAVAELLVLLVPQVLLAVRVL
jgi:hypothetical protein